MAARATFVAGAQPAAARSRLVPVRILFPRKKIVITKAPIRRREMLTCIAAAPLASGVGAATISISALLTAALARRLPGVRLDRLPSAKLAVRWRDAANGLLAALSASSDPVAVLAELERTVPEEPILRLDGWYLAQSDIVLLAAHHSLGQAEG